MFDGDLVRALRSGDERNIRYELNLLTHSIDWPLLLRAISFDEAIRLIARGDDATRVVLTSHPNGRIREAALQTLKPTDGQTLLTLLQRANDWVPTIARLAADRAIQALPEADVGDLGLAFPLVFALTRQRRVDHRDLIDEYRREVGRRPGLASYLRRSFGSGLKGLWAFQNLIGDDESAETVAREGLRNAQSGLQVAAARLMARDPTTWPTLMASGLSQIRRIGLDLAPAEARERALSDPHAGVRNDARYLLGKRDYAAWYAERLPSPGAVSGLGETGRREDARFLRPLLDHPMADVRRRALESLARLFEADAEPELRAGLRDPSRKVQRAAVESIVRLPLAVDPFETVQMNLAPRATWLLLDRAPPWAALLAVLAHVDRLPRSELWLRIWARRIESRPVGPRASEADDVVLLLGTTLPRLPVEIAAVLREAVRPWLR